ncbi:MAG: hypothetical protein IPN13_16500 [Bacteroidetes bacterium]|nr:hypothetical protein [Bacteroidota bacterium]
MGRAVYSEKINNEAIKQIHINDISSGIYFMKIFDGEKSFCKKRSLKVNNGNNSKPGL